MRTPRTLVAALLAAAALSACSAPETEKVRHVQKGDEYAAEKKDEFAVIEYASAIRIDPKYGEAHWKLAQTYDRMGNLQGAFPAFIRAADASPDDHQAQLKATEVLLITGRLEDAKARAATLVSKDPKDIEARLLRANAMAGLGEVKDAVAEVEEALKLNPRHSGALVTLGSVRRQAGQLPEAEAAFRQAIAADSESSGARLALASFLLRVGRAVEAEPVLDEILSKSPRHVLANRALADIYLSTARVKDAEGPLRIIAEESKDSGPRFQLAEYFENTGRTKDATELLESLSKDPNTFADAEIRLASLEYSQGRQAGAYKRADALLARVANYPPALATKARWLAAENRLDDALAMAQAAVAANGQSAEAYTALATVQERRQETADAIKSYTEVARLNPRAPGVQVNLSRLNLMMGQREAAVSLGEEARRSEPSSLSARITLARSLVTNDNLGRAEAEIGDLLRVAPQEAMAHALQGFLLVKKGSAAAARVSFERALELSPGLPEALGGLIALDLRAKASGTAIARLESELAKQPSSISLLTLAAQAYLSVGEDAKAEQALKRAVAVDSRFATGYTMLGRLYLRQRRLAQARAEFEGIAQRDPSAVGPRTMVGILLEAEGKRDDARQAYEKIVAAKLDAPVASNNLAYLYAEQGTNLETALQLATSAKSKLPDDPGVDDTLGWVFYKKNLPSLARGPLEASAKKLADNPQVLYHLGLTYAELGDNSKAREALSRARRLDPKIGGFNLDTVLASLSR